MQFQTWFLNYKARSGCKEKLIVQMKGSFYSISTNCKTRKSLITDNWSTSIKIKLWMKDSVLSTARNASWKKKILTICKPFWCSVRKTRQVTQNSTNCISLFWKNISTILMITLSMTYTKKPISYKLYTNSPFLTKHVVSGKSSKANNTKYTFAGQNCLPSRIT